MALRPATRHSALTTLPVVGGLWRGNTAVVVALGTILALVLGGVAAALVVAVTIGDQADLTEALLLAAVSNPVFLITLVGTQSTVMLLAVGWAMRRNRVSWHAMGLRRASWGWVFGAAALALPLLAFRLVTIIALALALQQLSGVDLLAEAQDPTTAQLLTPTGSVAAVIIAIVAVSVVVPIVEELVFRGVIHNALRNRMRFWPAAILSGLMFGIFHLNPLQALAAWGLGIACAWAYEQSESLWPPIALHAVNNFVAQGMIYVALLLPAPA